MAILGCTDIGSGVFVVTINHDPAAVSTDLPMGSIIIDSSGVLYAKLDDGDTTNVAKILNVNTPAKKSTTAGITAFATGGQASATALTKDVNEISTCATAGDSVKLLSAAAGIEQTVINNGAQACDVFPNTDDNLGAGVDTAVSLAAGTRITYLAYDGTNWV